jgi:membrane protease YdiL (CAAX protease family)
MALVAEMAAVFLAVLAVIVAIHWSGLQASWWVVPGVLVAAGVVPFAIKGQAAPPLGKVKTLGPDLRVVLYTCLAVFPATYVLVRLAYRMDLVAPPALAHPSSYLTWVAYQFLYVAVGEEIFFRGYVLSSLRLAFDGGRHTASQRMHGRDWGAVLVSSALFAVAHCAVQGKINAGVTFMPGLVLGWLFARTGRLLAPVVFHGAANVFWLLALS